MPQRNLMLILITSVISLLCYEQADRNRYASMLTEIMSVVERNYIKPVERNELFDHAMKGMITGLDPYSGYMTRDEYRPFLEDIEQKFGGVGILVEINPDTKRLTIMSPLYGTPAYKAGLKPGDTIMTIDGKDTEGLEFREAVGLMKGDPGSQVTLGILHRGADVTVDFKLTRELIQTESVLGDHRTEGARWDFHLEEDSTIAYVRIEGFGDKTADELKGALTNEDGTYGGYRAVIIDLRGNPGGTLQAAVEICDMFLDDGVIVSTRTRGGVEDDIYMAEPGVVVPSDVPVVVLVNHYSASASEIVAACLQDHDRAVVVGDRSWGKGTVQNVIEIDKGNKGALRLTTSSYWRPSGVNIHRDPDAKETDTWGVSPNAGLEVKLTDEEMEKVVEARAKKDAFRPYEDKTPPAEKPASEATTVKPEPPFEDPQLRKAIDYLQQKLPSKSTTPAKA